MELALKTSKRIRECRAKDLHTLGKSIYESIPKQRRVRNQDTGILVGFNKVSKKKSIYRKHYTRDYLVMLENVRKVIKKAVFDNRSKAVKPNQLRRSKIIAFLNFKIIAVIDGRKTKWWINVAIHKSGDFYFHYDMVKQKKRQ